MAMGDSVTHNGSSAQGQFNWHTIIFNPTILDCVVEHMPLEDIKRLRATCKQLNELITTRKRFRDDTVFVVCENSNPNAENPIQAFRTVEILKNTTVKWKNFKIVLYNDFFKPHNKAERELILALMKDNVEHLTIIGTKRFMRTVSCVLFLMEEWQIPRCENLTRLSMDFNLLNSMLISGFSFLTDKIKHIDILESKSKSEKGDEYDILTANLELIAQKCRKLEKFKIKNGFAPLMNKPEVKKHLLNILQMNAENLTAIEWLCDPIVESKEFESLRMPKLKELQAYCSKDSLTTTNFAANQLGLEKLSFIFFKKLPSYPIDQILQTMLRFKKTLTSVFVTFCSLESTNWECLEQMENLKNFYIFGMQDEGGIQHFSNFPRSLKGLILRELTMKESFYNDFWMSTFPFENATKLCLMNCKPSLSDHDMCEISSRMTNLKVLQISRAPFVTDAGITGKFLTAQGMKNSGVPLNNLKDIRELTLSSFSRITNAVESTLQFPSLRKLELVDNDSMQLTEDLLALLIVQNPQLEKLYFSLRSLPKYKRGGFESFQKFVYKKSQGQCSLIDETDKEEPDEFDNDQEEESDMDSEGNVMPMTAEEDAYDEENEWLDEEEDDEDDESD